MIKYSPRMLQSFDDKKALLLSDLRTLALRHNRDYYTSIIPFIEKTRPEESDLIDIYQAAIFQDGERLIQSRQAFESIRKVENLLLSPQV